MKNFYTIINFVPNKATNDSIAVGLLYFNDTGVQFYISDYRVKMLNKFIDNKAVNINFIINQLKKKVNSLAKKNVAEFDFNQLILTESFVNYLHIYSNGLLTFSEPKYISTKYSTEVYSNLIAYLFPEEKIEQKAQTVNNKFINLKNTVNKKLIKRVEDKVHTNFLINKDNLETIYFNYEIDCIGLNGQFIGAKTIDFDKSFQTIDKDVSHYFALISSLSSKYNKSLEKNNFYLISEEPKDINSKEHGLWESVYKNEIIEIINPEESDKVADLIEKKEAKTFF